VKASHGSSKWPASALSRRDLLKYLGLTATFLPSLAGAGAPQPRDTTRQSRAGARPIQRLLVFFITQGTYYPNWQIAPAGYPEDRPWELDLAGLGADQFSRCLQPLHSIRKQLLLLDGISFGMTGVFGTMPHHTGHAIALAGAKPTLDGEFVTRLAGPSIDQLIATGHQDGGPIASLHYGNALYPVCHDVTGAPIPSETDAPAAFRRLFPGAAGADGSVQPGAMLDARISVLDLVAKQTERMQRQLSAADRQKLDQHHSMIRDLERKLVGLQELGCGPVPRPAAEPSDPIAWVDWHTDTWTDLALVALSCGMSRVVTVYDPGPTPEYLGLPGASMHTEYAHTAGFLETSNDAMTDFYRHYVTRFERLVSRLSAIPEGEGSMLDNTLVMLANELGNPNHDWQHYPMVLAGGGHRFRLGRYLRFPAEDLMKGPFADLPTGPAHHRVLVSVAQAFGLDVDHVGERSLPSSTGGEIDVTGPLDGLV